MTQAEFRELRKLPDKEIHADIVFRRSSKTAPNLSFTGVPVSNALDIDVRLNGTYKPDIPSVTFNFVVAGVGPICRIDANGSLHGPAGRTHKHELRQESDPSNSLPDPRERPDLRGKTAREIWDILCMQARITHTGAFVDPGGVIP